MKPRDGIQNMFETSSDHDCTCLQYEEARDKEEEEENENDHDNKWKRPASMAMLAAPSCPGFNLIIRPLYTISSL